MTNRHSDNTESITAIAARNMAAGLRLIADEYDRMANLMDKAKINHLDAPGLITGMDGLVKVSRFCGSIQETLCINTALDSVADVAGAAYELKRRIHRLKDEAAPPDVASESAAGKEGAELIHQKGAEKRNRKKADS
jgi:hypothetical protein